MPKLTPTLDTCQVPIEKKTYKKINKTKKTLAIHKKQHYKVKQCGPKQINKKATVPLMLESIEFHTLHLSYTINKKHWKTLSFIKKIPIKNNK